MLLRPTFHQRQCSKLLLILIRIVHYLSSKVALDGAINYTFEIV